MTKSGNLWAVGYDDMGRANQVRDEIISLGWDKHYLILDDVAVVVRHPRRIVHARIARTFPAACQHLGLQCGGISCRPGSRRSTHRCDHWRYGRRHRHRVAVLASVGIGDDFIREVKGMMKPGTSAIFVLDDEGRYGRDIAQDTRPGRNGVEDQRGSGAGTADPVNAGRAFGTNEQIGREIAGLETQTMSWCLMLNSCAMSALWRYPQTGEARTLNASLCIKRPAYIRRFYGETTEQRREAKAQA